MQTSKKTANSQFLNWSCLWVWGGAVCSNEIEMHSTKGFWDRLNG